MYIWIINNQCRKNVTVFSLRIVSQVSLRKNIFRAFRSDYCFINENNEQCCWVITIICPLKMYYVLRYNINYEHKIYIDI